MLTRHVATLGNALVLSNLYPQPNASAAGSRTSYILRQLVDARETWKSVHFAASAKEVDDAVVEELESHGVCFHSIEPNKSNEIAGLLDRIGTDLALVLYDKFYTEEAYSFHVHNLRPEAVQVVDMQDMHSMRLGRQSLVTKRGDGWHSLQESISHCPSAKDDALLRELASLHRSDLSLVCSPVEHDLLVQTYQMAPSKLCTASFWVDAISDRKPWADRNHFCFVGGFRHAPNVDAVKQLARTIWPTIRKRLPTAELHIYGAHPNNAIQQVHNPKEGIHMIGFCEDLEATLSRYRALLAPLRFGAGIKGKIVDAWRCDLPVITTPIGSEGMTLANGEWGGAIAISVPEFCDAAVDLYSNEDEWNASGRRGQKILRKLYSKDNWYEVSATLQNAVVNRVNRRSVDFTRSILWDQQMRSTEFFSRWIEAKNR